MAPPSLPPSLYPTDSIRDVAESLGLNAPSSHVAAALAADVEYRIRSIVQVSPFWLPLPLCFEQSSRERGREEQ